MNRIIAALMALILIMSAISAAGCEAKEDPYKGYCTAVSYTHLDVYKRQAGRSAERDGFRGA